MIPEPSKRPFTHPLDLPALSWFCHPRHEDFRQPVRHAGGVWAANGYAAIRVTRGPVTYDTAVPEASPAFVERVEALPWRLVSGEKDPKFLGEPVWRKLDDSRGTIYRGGADGLRPLWPAGRMTEEVPVMVAASCSVPLAMLQLLARLPRAEVRMSTGDFLAIRFSGGEAIIPGRWRHAAIRPAAKFSLFLTKEHLEQFRDRAR